MKRVSVLVVDFELFKVVQVEVTTITPLAGAVAISTVRQTKIHWSV